MGAYRRQVSSLKSEYSLRLYFLYPQPNPSTKAPPSNPNKSGTHLLPPRLLLIPMALMHDPVRARHPKADPAPDDHLEEARRLVPAVPREALGTPRVVRARRDRVGLVRRLVRAAREGVEVQRGSGGGRGRGRGEREEVRVVRAVVSWGPRRVERGDLGRARACERRQSLRA